ncbi:MAG: hypothetical protein HWN65_18815 [Candidatus Helarchaeota archaeon]|nr:hypothetical protein [Candidatus Helarchaeota archaeon]
MKINKSIFLMFIFITSTILPISFMSHFYSSNGPVAILDDSPNTSFFISQNESQSYYTQWLQNPNLTSPIEPTWYWTSAGDTTDITANDGNGQANVTVIGEKGSVSIFEDQPNATEWLQCNNSEVNLRPTFYAVNESGKWWAAHYWVEQDNLGNAYTSIQWKKNYTLSKDLSDYEITGVSINSTVNGTVQAGALQNGGVEVPGDTVNFGSVYDYVRFYVRISDLPGNKEYELAYNRTKYLGQGDAPGTYDYMYDTLMSSYSEDIMIAYLTSVLETDGRNFTMILGIDIYCDENHQTDEDYFNALRIKSFNLTFSYEKKIDRGVSAEWAQIGNKLPSGNVQVDSARLHFKYKTDKNWTALTDSPNSEFRMIIGNNTHTETVKIETANSTYQEARVGGFDVTTLILQNVNITVKIQVYLADNFLLTENLTISLDDIYLYINYTVFVIPPPGAPNLNIVANATTLFTNQWTQLTVTCENTSAENVSQLWYNNPFDGINYTLATDFTGLQTHYLNFTSASAGPYQFRFWANSTTGAQSNEELYIVWLTPTYPSLTVTANTTNLFNNYWTQLTVTCENGSGRVDLLWYLNPFDSTNYTLATNFTGQQISLLNFTSAIAGPYVFKFWANSSLGMGIISEKEITIVWNTPQGAILSLVANETTPYTNQWTNLTVTCQSGSANVHTLWYYNPLDSANHTLATDFAGTQVFNIINTTAVAGSHTYQFWANSTLGADAVKSLLIVWVEPQAPILTVTANDTSPYTTQWTNITGNCQSGSGNVDTLWYFNPLDGQNHTLATDFSGLQVFNIINMTGIAGSYTYRFWANSSFGLLTYETFTVFWTTPQDPIITANANTTNPFINLPSNITVTCQSGSGNVHTFWYYNPLDTQNHTLATDFAGIQVVNIINTTGIAGSYTYRFWANSSLGLITEESITIVWVSPQPPILTVTTNATSPYINQLTNITVTCRSGTGNTDMLWYYNPLDSQNHTLGTDFSGNLIHHILNATGTAGSYTYRFWANSTYGLLATVTLTIFWLDLQAPILNVISNDTNPLINEWIMLTITCQSTSGNVHTLWYWDDVGNQNITLDTDFSGSRIHLRNHTTGTAGAYTFEFWANSTFGLLTHTSLPVVWRDPQNPIVSVIANITTLYATEYTQLIITCQSGTGNIHTAWYEDPISGQNITLATDFAGSQIFYRDHTSSTASPYLFTVWANSSLGLEAMDDITIVWLAPIPPTLTIDVSDSNPDTGKSTQITVVCRSGTGNISVWWYYNPITEQNVTIDTDFFGERTWIRDFTSEDPGTYIFEFWANSTYGVVTYDSVTVVWTGGQPIGPIVIVLAAVLAAVAAAFLAYQLYFKVPKTVRTIRKTKSAIRKGKATTPLKVPARESVVQEMFNKRLKIQKLPSKRPEAPSVTKSKLSKT